MVFGSDKLRYRNNNCIINRGDMSCWAILRNTKARFSIWPNSGRIGHFPREIKLSQICQRNYSVKSSKPVVNDVTVGSGIQTGKLPRAANITPTKVLRRSAQAKNKAAWKYQASQLLPCTTITSCEAYDLPKVIEVLHSKGFKDACFLIPQEAVHLTYPSFEKLGSSRSSLSHDIMVLVNGSVVGWGFEEAFLKKEFLPLVGEAQINPYNMVESDEIDYVERKTYSSETGQELFTGESGMDNDIMVIDADTTSERLLDKAAFSFGLARSTRLAILETQLENCIAETKQNTLTFSKGITRRNKSQQHAETLKMIGKLLLIRGQLNLYSELIETPDLYWSEPTLEDLYKKISKNLDIVPRIGILNKKLDYATEECRILLSTLNDAKASQLELIIIYLIMIEVCFEIYHFYERYWLDRNVLASETAHSS